MNYKVLWMDDEFETLELIREDASIHDIELIGFSNSEDGIKELEKHFHIYDAVLLDGKFYVKSGYSGDTVSEAALVDVIRMLDTISQKKILPWFILSGQPSFTKEENLLVKHFTNGKVYDKNRQADIEALWNDVKNEANKQTDTQIRLRYARVFEVCTDHYAGPEVSKYLMPILIHMQDPKFDSSDEHYFNGLRKVIELIFRACNRYGFLHDKCIQNDIINLSWSSIFMSGKEVNLPSGVIISSDKPHFPVIISNAVKSILEITSVASHTEGENKDNGKSNLKEYRKWLASPYLLYSLTFQLLDVLLWFKSYADANPDPEINRAMWKIEVQQATVIHTGPIMQDRDRNFYCGNYLLNPKIINEHYKVGDMINVLQYEQNAMNKSKNLYPYFATRFEPKK